MSVAGFLLGLAGFLLALGVAIGQRRQANVQRQQTNIQNDLQARLTEIEEARHAAEMQQRASAEIRVQFTRVGKGHRMVVTNGGTAVAADVEVVLDPNEAEHGPFLHEPPFPCTIHPGQPITVMAMVSGATKQNISAVIRWRDETGPQERTVLLSVP